MSAELKRELGFWDLVWFNIAAIVGLRWLAVAATAGFTSITFWFLAFLFFFLPQTFVVYRLSRKWPVEGGLYEWTKNALGPFHGFVSGWCYWANNIVYYPTVLAAGAGFATYIFAPKTIGWDQSPMYVFVFSLISLWIVLGLNTIGLNIGKWVQNIGGISTWIPAGIVIILGALYFAKFGSATPFDTKSLIPEMSIGTLKTLAPICFALAGFELISLMGGEIKNPERNIPRSIPVSGAMATFIYVLGTIALLVSVPAEKVNILAGVVQAIHEQLSTFGWAFLTGFIALALVISQMGGVGAWLAGSGRVLYVVGVDRYLPKIFSKVHPKWGTPYISIITQGMLSTLFLILSVSDTVKEFYLTLVDFTTIIYFIPYVYLFYSYFVLMRKKEIPFDLYGILASIFGFLATIIAIVLSMLPPEDSKNVLWHEIRMIGGTLIMVVPAILLYYRAHRTASASA
jgi:amino acid transporter